MSAVPLRIPTQPNQAFFAGGSSRETIWGHPHIAGEAVLSTTKIFTGEKPSLKAYMNPFDIMEIEMLTLRGKSVDTRELNL
jgi:hypothetical protein